MRDSVAIFGLDYDTIDGTGVRDYIHVEDLADAHLKALAHLEGGGENLTLNCGYGYGYSVREVLRTVEAVNGSKLAIDEQGRRPGDPAHLVARAERIRQRLGWKPRYDDLEVIVRTTLEWEKELQKRRGGGPD